MSSYFSEVFLKSLAEPQLNPCASSFQPRGSETGLGTSFPPLLDSDGGEVEFYYPNPRASSGLKAYVNSRFCDVSRRDAELLGLLAPRRPLPKNLANKACSYCYSRSTHFCWHPFKDNCSRIVCPLISYKLAVLKNYRKHRAPSKTTMKQNQCNLSVSMAASISFEESDSTSSSFISTSERRSSLKMDSGANSRESGRQRASLAQEADRQTYEAEFYQKLQECEREYSSKSSGEIMMYMPVSERIANRSRQLSATVVTSSKDKRFRIAELRKTGQSIPEELPPIATNNVRIMDTSKKDVTKPISRCGISSLSSGSEGKSYNQFESFKPQWRNWENDGRDDIAQSSLSCSSTSSSGESHRNSILSYDSKGSEEIRKPQAESLECVSNSVKSSSNKPRVSLFNRSVSVSDNKSKFSHVSTQSLSKMTEELRQALSFLRKHLANSSVFSAIVSNERNIVRDAIKSLESSLVQFSVVHQQSEHSSQNNANICRAISYLNKLIDVRKDEVISLLRGSCSNFNDKRLGILLNTLDENCSVQECKFHKFNRQRYWKDLNHLCDFFLICCGKERKDKTLTKVLELLRSIDNDGSNSLGQIYINFLAGEMSKDVRRKLLESNGRPLFYLVDFIEYCKLYLKVSLLKLQVQKEPVTRDLNNNVISSPTHVAWDSGTPNSVSTICHSVPSTPLATPETRMPCSEFLSLRPRLFPQLAGRTSIVGKDSTNINGSHQSGKLLSSHYGLAGQSDQYAKPATDQVCEGDLYKTHAEVSALHNLEMSSQNKRDLHEEKVGRSRYNILVMCKLENSFKNLRIFDYIMDNSRAIVWNKIENVFAFESSSGGVCGNKAFIKDMEDRLIVRRDGNDML